MFGLFWWLISVFMTVRLYQMAKVALRLLRLHVVYPRLGWTFPLHPYKNSWAVVTGGTDGIGRAYVKEMAAKGFTKFALIGRSEAKLLDVRRFLRTEHKADVEVLVFDFASTEYGPLEDFVRGLGEIGALWNFVGTVAFGAWCEHAEGVAPELFTVNALSAVKLTDLVLPGMVRRDKGLIVHCSSATGYRPTHMASSYSAAKAAMSFLSETCAMEYSSKSLRIQCLYPLFVSTQMTNFTKPNAMVLSAEEYARDAASIVGLDSYAMGALRHELQLLAMAPLPPWLWRYAYAAVLRRLTRSWRLQDRPKAQ